MREQKIVVKEVVGRSFSSRTDGKKLRLSLEKDWHDVDQFVVDFDGLEIASVSFLDEAIGHLVEHYSLNELKSKLSFVNMDEGDRKLLNYIVLSRNNEKTKYVSN